MKNTSEIYNTIIAGAGAAGLFYAANDTARQAGSCLILEKTEKAGCKLLITGNGMCNITHAGSIKDYVTHYGKNGGKIRGCLYRHNNTELMSWLESNGVTLTEREDGKVFPASLKAKDILDLLLRKSEENGYKLCLKTPVTGVTADDDTITVSTPSGNLRAEKLVIATGGASFPDTGSDGSFLSVLENDLSVKTEPLKPALVPIYTENYRYSKISGVSFENTVITFNKTKIIGALLFTHKNLSGPAALHMSQYIKAGDKITINFLPDTNREKIFQKIKEDHSGNSKSPANYLSQTFSLPKAFTQILCSEVNNDAAKLSSLTHKELEKLSSLLTCHEFTVSGTGGFKEAMVTAGGVSLPEIDLKNMSLKNCPRIHVIGEALDINGDTGGYNLQFAYSSAKAALGI